MKKSIIPMAAAALLLASCSTDTKDSYQTLTYRECNLIVDNQDPSQPSQASEGSYEVKYNLTRNVIDIKSSDIIVNNQKYSFETDTMGIRPVNFKVDGLGDATNLAFSKKGSTGVGSSASDLTGAFVWLYIPQSNDVLNPSYSVSVGQRLDLRYTLSDRYSVQTFWPAAFFRGQTISSADNQTHTTKQSDYLTKIDLEKKTASVYVYNAELSADQDKSFPKVIRFEDIPVIFNHNGFTIESAAPKTTILGKKDNKTAMVDSVGFAATDFSMVLTSPDLTEVMINYNLDGRYVSFRGCSIMKPGF